MDVVAWSASEAQRLLGPLGSRWTHTRAVADRASEIAAAVSIEDRPTLLAAAYLHDIGYAPDLASSGFHPLDGALWLRRQGRERLVGLVAHHSGARFEATVRGCVDALGQFSEEHSAVADALTYCDLTTGPEGETIAVADRLAEIELRYGAASLVAQGMSAAAETLGAAVRRIEARLTRISHAA